MRRESAEMMAARALGWLATHEDLLPVFMNSTGVTVSDIRCRADDADFLASVLDFLSMDDNWVMAFCDAQTISYASFREARAALPGGEEVHWT